MNGRSIDEFDHQAFSNLANSSWVRSSDCCVCIVCISNKSKFLQNQMRRWQDHKMHGNAHVQNISKYFQIYFEYVCWICILQILFVYIALPATQTWSWKFEILWHQRWYESRCTELELGPRALGSYFVSHKTSGIQTVQLAPPWPGQTRIKTQITP